MNENNSNLILDSLGYKFKLSYAEKSAKNWKWLEDTINKYDYYGGVNKYYNDEKIEKYKIYYDIIKGKGQSLMDKYVKTEHNPLLSEGINISNNRIIYRDILTPILRSMSGEYSKSQLDVVMHDFSSYNLNLKKKKRLELYQDYIKTNIVSKINQEVTQELLIKYGVEDPSQLSPEEQDQLKSEIDQAVQFKLPEDIERFMESEYKSPSEQLGQSIIKYIENYHDIKFILNEGFTNFITTGMVVMNNKVINNTASFELLNNLYFDYFSSKNTHFIEDGSRFRYDRFLTLGDLLNNYDFKKSDYKKLNDILYNSINSFGTDYYYRNQIRNELSDDIVNKIKTVTYRADGVKVEGLPENYTTSLEKIDLRNAIYQKFGSKIFNDDPELIRVSNHVIEAYDKLYYVRRIDKHTGKMKSYWVGENFEPNPELDYSVDEKWIKAYYGADKIGYSDNIILNKGRIKFQNRSINNPFKLNCPYVGIEYAKMFNNSTHISPLSYGLPYAYEYSILKHKIEELDAKDMGKLIGFPESYKPHKWSYGKLVSMSKKTPLLPLDTVKGASVGVDNTLFKVIDLSNDANISNKIQRLEYIKRDAEFAMSYSPAALGTSPASTTATVNQQNIIQHGYKTQDVYATYNKFVENFFNNSVNLVRNLMKENSDLKEYFVNDLSGAEIDIDDELYNLMEIGCKVVNTKKIKDTIQFLKNELLPKMIAVGIPAMDDVIRLQLAETIGEILNIQKDFQRKQEKIAAENAKAAEKERKDNRDLAIELEKMKQDREDRRLQLELNSKELGYRLESEKFQKAADSDNDKIPDSVEVAKIKADVERYKINEKTKVDRLKINKENNKNK